MSSSVAGSRSAIACNTGSELLSNSRSRRANRTQPDDIPEPDRLIESEVVFEPLDVGGRNVRVLQVGRERPAGALFKITNRMIEISNKSGFAASVRRTT